MDNPEANPRLVDSLVAVNLRPAGFPVAGSPVKVARDSVEHPDSTPLFARVKSA